MEGLPHDLASVLKVEDPAPSHPGASRGSGPLPPEGVLRGSEDMLVKDSSIPALRPIQVLASSHISYVKKSSKISSEDSESANVALDVLSTKGLKSLDGLGDSADNNQIFHADFKETNEASQEDSGVLARSRSVRTPVGTPKGTARSEFTMEHREGEKSSGSTPRRTESPMLMRYFSRRSVYADAQDSVLFSGKFSWRRNLDGDEASPLDGRYSMQVSMARSGISGSEYDDFVDAQSRIGSEGESDFDSPVSVQRATHFDGDELNHAALKNHVEAQKAYMPPGMELMDYQQSTPTPGKLSENSDDVTQRKDVQPTDNGNGAVPKSSSISTILYEGSTASSVSSGQSHIIAGVAIVRDQQPGPPKTDNRSCELLRGHGNGNLDSYVQVVPALAISEGPDESNLLSTATNPTSTSLGSSSSVTIPTHEGCDVLQPSFSMFHRHSISSELISVSSDSEPPSPPSPHSPAFHTLYSPREFPPRASNNEVNSLLISSLRPCSPGTKKSNLSSPSLGEVPVLSESPISFPRSPHHALPVMSDPPVADVPLKPEPARLPSRPGVQLYPLPTPPMDTELDNISNSRELSYAVPKVFCGPDILGKHGESARTLPADEGDVHPVLKSSPTSVHDTVTAMNERAGRCQPVPLPVVSSNGGDIPRSPQCGTPWYPAFSESTIPSSGLYPRTSGSPGSSVPSSPLGSPEESSQGIPLSISSALATPNPLGGFVYEASCNSSQRDESSAPSSPSGSVIIRDSPPESPLSASTGSDFESGDFDAIQGRPETSGSAGFFGQVKKEPLFKREGCVDVAPSIVRVKSKSLQAASSPEKTESLLSVSTSNSSEVAVEICSKVSLNNAATNGSADHSVSQEVFTAAFLMWNL